MSTATLSRAQRPELTDQLGPELLPAEAIEEQGPGRAERRMTWIFGGLTVYSLVYLLVLALKFQV